MKSVLGRISRISGHQSISKIIVVVAAILLSNGPASTQSTTPRLDSVAPSSGVQGATLKLILNGSGFNPTSSVRFSGSGVIVQSVRFISSTSLEATIVLSAPPNTYSVSISNGTNRSNDQPFSVLSVATAAASEFDVASFGDTASRALAYDPFQLWVISGQAYITDYTDSVVKKVSLSSGTVTTLAGKAGESGAADGIGTAARFGQPAGIWADDRSVYVTDTYFGTIRQISLLTGQVTTLAGSSSSATGSDDGVGFAARFNSPTGLWGDGTNLYVCDSANFTLRRISIATGEVTTLAGAPRLQGMVDGVGSTARFLAPMDVWGDGVYLYVADGSAIRKVTIATGAVQTLSGSRSLEAEEPTADAPFGFISGIWGDGVNLFVADSGNDVIHKVSLETGAITTVAGLALTSGNANGRGQAARFDSPTDLAGDGSAIYIIDRMNSDIKRATAPSGSSTTRTLAPATLANQIRFQLENRGGASQVTSGESVTVQAGYGRLLPSPGSTTPSGLAIFGYRREGVLVSEASVPVSQLISDGRIPVQIDGPVNTGIAIANPNTQAATFSFYFADEKGARLYTGTTEIPGGGLVAAFLNQSPFAPPNQLGIDLANARTFTFSSSVAVGMTAIRGLTNERSDFLVTTLPVVRPALTDASPVVFAHYADGGGWKTQLILVNPTENILTGVAEFFTQGSVSTGSVDSNPPQSMLYGIAPRSAVTLRLSGSGSQTRTGWIRVTPSDDMQSPSGVLIFSYQANGITVTEAGIPSVPEAQAFRLFVEASGDFNHHDAGSIQSGFAISNSSDGAAAVSLELFALDGTSTGFRDSVTIPARGQVAMFLDQVPSFKELQTPFQGFVRISGSSVGVVGLRSRYNEREDFLITTTTPVSESASPSTTETVFPYFVDGGGYTTQFILFSGTAGQVSNGTLSFVSPTGSPLALPLR